MALLAESLVEEWLNRDGYFTIRGVKHGVGEMDLLAIRPERTGGIVGWHVEVQISFRPIGYIGTRTEEMVAESGGSRTSARARTPAQVEVCAREWVHKKFRDPEKVRLRQRLWPGVEWSFHLVHAVVREPRELEVFAAEGVKCHPFHELLTALSKRSKRLFFWFRWGRSRRNRELLQGVRALDTGCMFEGCLAAGSRHEDFLPSAFGQRPDAPRGI